MIANETFKDNLSLEKPCLGTKLIHQRIDFCRYILKFKCYPVVSVTKPLKNHCRFCVNAMAKKIGSDLELLLMNEGHKENSSIKSFLNSRQGTQKSRIFFFSRPSQKNCPCNRKCDQTATRLEKSVFIDLLLLIILMIGSV